MKPLFVKLNIDFMYDPEVTRLSAAAQLTYLMGLTLAKRLFTDGRLEAGYLHGIFHREHLPQEEQITAELVTAGLWERTDDGGYLITGWLKHNEPAKDIQRKIDDKREIGQKGGRASAATRKQTPSKPEALCLPSASASASASAPDPAKQTPTQSTETEVETETEQHSLRSCSSECAREDLPVESPSLDDLGVEQIPNALPAQPDFDLQECLEPVRSAQRKFRRPVNECIVELVARRLHVDPVIAQTLGHQSTAQEVGAILADWAATGRPVQVQSLIPSGPNSRAPSGDPWWAICLQRSLDPARRNGQALDLATMAYRELR